MTCVVCLSPDLGSDFGSDHEVASITLSLSLYLPGIVTFDIYIYLRLSASRSDKLRQARALLMAFSVLVVVVVAMVAVVAVVAVVSEVSSLFSKLMGFPTAWTSR